MLSILIEEGFKVTSAMQHLNDMDNRLLGEISIENQVLWKAGDEDPAQANESTRTKAAKRSAFGPSQQRKNCLINGLFPPLSQGKIRDLQVIIRLFDHRDCGGLGDAQSRH